MLSKVKIGNFKSIEELELELAPLTIFVGPNSSGKSNVLENIAILAQTTRLRDRIVRSLLGSLEYGEFVRYPSTSDFSLFDFIAHKKDWSKFITFEIHITDAEYHDIGYMYAFMPKDEEVRQAVFANEKKLVEVGNLRVGKSTTRQEVLYPEEFKESLQLRGDTDYILNPTCFKFALTKKLTNQEQQQIEEISSKAQEIVKKIETTVRDVYLISAIRGEVRPIVEIGVGEPGLGTHGEGLIEILALIFRRPEYEKISGKIIKWASKFGMEGIKAGWWGKNILSSDYIDPELQTRLNMALASQGSRQILTIITQLFWSRPGSVIMIEEPEISLHIEAQLELPKMFSEAIKEGKQVIVTTHSEHLILALKPLIVNGELKPEDVAIWHFEKTEEGTKAERLNLTDKGIIEGWIPSYVKAEGEIIKEWFDTLPED
ncbi:MAG: ATP-binding protein [Candidatus Syntrophoarchaeum sp.]|nr:ATP-binding protein [Candidatus Syntrophoarchaeum sp.]